jgi:hypothetical protein
MGVPLVSPSCVNAGGEWMESFMEQVQEKGFRVNAIGVHSYGGSNVAAFQRKLQSLFEKFQRPLLVTEFAVADWKAPTPDQNRHAPKEVLAFMKAILPWMEAQEWIIGYAWFSFDIACAAGTSSALFDPDGNLTELGRFYAEFQANTSY